MYIYIHMKITRIALALLLPVIVLSCAQRAGFGEERLTEAYFSLGYSDAFFDFPFPSDLRLKEGRIDLAGFPNPQQVEMLDTYITMAQETLQGFGTNSPIYIRFTGPLDTSTFPATPEDSLESDSSVFLVDIDELSPEYGLQIPIIWEFMLTATTYTPSNLLAVAPMWGFPLRPSTKYALVVTDGVRDSKGGRLGIPIELRYMLSWEIPHPKFMEGWSVFSPLRNYLMDMRLNVKAATVFTTHDPVDELRTIRDYIYSDLPVGQLLDMTFSKTTANYFLFEGHYTSPNFQKGEPPYMEEGGQIEFDLSGKPIVQRWEALRFALVIPTKFSEPPNGFPIVTYAHGTGGNYKTYLRSGHEGDVLTDKGLAVVGIDQPLHGPRAPEGTQVEVASFNFFNPYAGRSNFRQSVIDSFSLMRLIRAGGLTITAGVFLTPTSFNPDKVSFMGHSHGGLTGAMFLALDPYAKGGVLSGAGGGLSMTLVLRKLPIDILGLLKSCFQISDEEITTFHPIIGLIQAISEATDPINYARHYYHDLLTEHSRSIFMTEGFIDFYTPPVTAEALAIAGGLPLIHPVVQEIPGLAILGLSSLNPPVIGNLRASNGEWVTGGIAQYVAPFPPPYDNGHYVIYDVPEARERYSDFLSTLAYTGSARIN